jgi:hypothetical protein
MKINQTQTYGIKRTSITNQLLNPEFKTDINNLKRNNLYHGSTTEIY